MGRNMMDIDEACCYFLDWDSKEGMEDLDFWYYSDIKTGKNYQKVVCSENDYSLLLHAFDTAIACMKAHHTVLSVIPFIVNMQIT